MLVVLEGIDKSGKTTLHHDLIDELNKEYLANRLAFTPLTYKLGFKPRNHLEREAAYYQYLALLDLHDQNNCLIVSDRSYISELVYSAVKKDYEAMADQRYQKFLNREDVLLVYVSTDYDEYVKRFKEEKEDFAEVKDIPRLLERYDEVLGMCSHKIIRIKTPSDRYENVKIVRDEIMKLIDETYV